MQSKDQMSAAEFADMREALEAGFRELALMHERYVGAAVEAWQAHSRAEPADEFKTLESAQHLHRMGDLVKALMWARFPAATLAWFGRDD